ncbi:hypothetical protein PGTUg99_026361 [Puccinia graminis f. sp. tritici]|uniref:Uncharacterized protein n=1 Tax=Puccinia graminis f. sp. tritici TaxID=56615 RepID=A0A5B0RUM1_PUCGR|nr:hypothetical protein PGTUg99_026361 [Puccinia graminis f. sp. tritici]
MATWTAQKTVLLRKRRRRFTRPQTCDSRCLTVSSLCKAAWADKTQPLTGNRPGSGLLGLIKLSNRCRRLRVHRAFT